MILDVHTHNPREPHAIASGTPAQVRGWLATCPRGLYSVGIHPWDTGSIGPAALEAHIQELASIAEHPKVAAIGETGLDSMRGAPIELQRTIFIRHIELSEQLCKPLVLHVVRQQDAVLHLLRKLPFPVTQPWIWHGYRGTPRRAAEVIETSPLQYISFGTRFHPMTPASVPPERILLESDSPDDIQPDIRQLASNLGKALTLTPEETLDRTTATAERIFGKTADNS